jgi:hypothetical protein
VGNSEMGNQLYLSDFENLVFHEPGANFYFAYYAREKILLKADDSKNFYHLNEGSLEITWI